MKYYPVLLSKAGELKALLRLSLNTKSQISPILQVVEDNFDAISKLLNSEWVFSNNELLLDLSLVNSLDNKLTAVEVFVDALVNAGTNIVLVIDSNLPAPYLHLVKSLCSKYKIKVCFRVLIDSSSITTYSTNVGRVLAFFNKMPSKTLLMLDCGYIQSGDVSRFAADVTSIIHSLPNANEFYRIIVGSGSAPENLSNLSANALHLLRRYEWDLWLQLQYNSLPPNLRFSDYGIKYPAYSIVNFTGTCSIKYTTASHYAIYRGELSGNHPLGNGQYIQFAKQLIQSPHYSGRNFSWGDEKVDTIAGQNLMAPPRIKPGNAQTWVEISQNHHITLIESML